MLQQESWGFKPGLEQSVLCQFSGPIGIDYKTPKKSASSKAENSVVWHWGIEVPFAVLFDAKINDIWCCISGCPI